MQLRGEDAESTRLMLMIQCITAGAFQEYVAVMEPLVLEECGALLLRGNEDAEIMCSAPAVTSGVAQDVRHESMMAECALASGLFSLLNAHKLMRALSLPHAH